MGKLKYLISKAIVYLQIPSIKNCILHKTVKVGQRSNLLDVNIGKYSYVGRNNNITNTIIGSYCSLGTAVTIGGGLHPLDRISTSPLFYDAGNDWKTSRFIADDNTEIEQVKTFIGNDVWIGDNTYIKAGKHIGDGVIIGSGSVVTHDIPPYAIVAGVPAKIIRFRFSEEVIEKLLNSKWWEMDESYIESHKECFTKVVSTGVVDKLTKD